MGSRDKIEGRVLSGREDLRMFKVGGTLTRGDVSQDLTVGKNKTKQNTTINMLEVH